MQAVICFEMLYPALTPEQKIENIANCGFAAVEFWGWRDKDIPAIKTVCANKGVRVANFSGHRRGSLISLESHPVFFEDLKDAVIAADRLSCSTLMLLTNELGQNGRVIDPYRGIPMEKKRQNLLNGLAEALDKSPQHITLVLEPLNTRLDHPGYYLDSMSAAVEIINELNNPRLKALCDLYHLGMMEESPLEIVERYIQEIGYIHIADIPGRHEPGTGNLDWPEILKRIRQSGYSGDVGFEYAPRDDSTDSLNRILTLWNEICV